MAFECNVLERKLSHDGLSGVHFVVYSHTVMMQFLVVATAHLQVGASPSSFPHTASVFALRTVSSSAAHALIGGYKISIGED
jgi:hypothetical protein